MGLIDSIIGAESGGNPSSLTARVIQKDFFGSRIGKLFFAGSPAAVFGRIIAVASNSINGMRLGRLLAHVCKKIGEAGAPSGTNLNACCTIPFVRDVIFVFASSDHAAPRVIFGSCRHPLGEASRRPVSNSRLAAHFVQKAPAANRIAGSQVWNRDNFLLSAIAVAKHLTNLGAAILSDPRLRFRDGGQFTKLGPDAVYGSSH